MVADWDLFRTRGCSKKKLYGDLDSNMVPIYLYEVVSGPSELWWRQSATTHWRPLRLAKQLWIDWSCDRDDLRDNTKKNLVRSHLNDGSRWITTKFIRSRYDTFYIGKVWILTDPVADPPLSPRSNTGKERENLNDQVRETAIHIHPYLQSVSFTLYICSTYSQHLIWGIIDLKSHYHTRGY